MSSVSVCGAATCAATNAAHSSAFNLQKSTKCLWCYTPLHISLLYQHPCLEEVRGTHVVDADAVLNAVLPILAGHIDRAGQRHCAVRSSAVQVLLIPGQGRQHVVPRHLVLQPGPRPDGGP